MAITLHSLRSLLLSAAVLLVGHGLQLTLLPLRAQEFGWSNASIGLTGSAYYLGFIVGCLWVTRIIVRVGHVRAFAVSVALAALSILGLAIFEHYYVWLLLRLLTGVSLAGFYTVIESWLNDQTDNEQRGLVLAVYTMVTLGAMAAGQVLIGDWFGLDELFLIACMLIMAATLPIALTTRPQPEPPAVVTFSLALAYRASQVGFVAAGVSGLVMGLLWSLGAAHVAETIGNPETGARFLIAVLAGGLILQLPAGRLSDRSDRRWIILALAVTGLVGTAVWLLSPPVENILYFAGFLCGAATLPMYSISIAHANDNAAGDLLPITSGMLLINGVCAMFGPLAYGILRQGGLEQALPIAIATGFLICLAWSTLRLLLHDVDRSHFEPYQPVPKTTLEVVDLAIPQEPAEIEAERPEHLKLKPE